MRHLFFISLLVFCTLTLQGQPISKEYTEFSAKADTALYSGKYNAAIELYKLAFAQNNGIAKVVHRYKLAAAFTQVDLADSAFVQLDRIATKGKFKEYEIISKDLLFLPLHADARWEPLLEKVRMNFIEFEKSKKSAN
jgi:hypothetical protein